MKTMMRHVCAALLAIAFTRAWADAAPVPVERSAALTSRVPSGPEALASWSGSIRGEAVGDTAAPRAGDDAGAASARSARQVLASWTGAIPGAARDAMAGGSGREAAATSHTEAQLLASWAGSIGGG